MIAAIDDKVIIYDTSSGDPRKWKALHEFDMHDMCVSSVDWSPKTNQILSVSHDRNAFVWTHNKESDKWEPKLVVLRIDRGANDVKWSPNGKKFAVASSAKKVPISYYEDEQDWWISLMIKQHKSSVLSLDWHPNSQIIATGSCDFKCRVFCAHMPEIDKEQDNGPFEGKLEDAPEFGDLMIEFPTKGWVESVVWSPSGKRLAFASHNSVLSVVDFSGEDVDQQILKLDILPLRDITFVSETRILGVGYNFEPYVFDDDGEEWTMTGSIDNTKNEKKKEKKSTAASFWKNKTKLGQTKATKALKSKHDNTITCVRKKKDGVYTTTGLDGRVFEWKVKSKA